jgi:hypothetical protein
MNPNISNENDGFQFSLWCTIIITVVLVFMEGYLRTGILNPFKVHYCLKILYLAIPIFLAFIIPFNVKKSNRRKEVEKLEYQREELRDNLKMLRTKQEEKLAQLRKLQ